MRRILQLLTLLLLAAPALAQRPYYGYAYRPYVFYPRMTSAGGVLPPAPSPYASLPFAAPYAGATPVAPLPPAAPLPPMYLPPAAPLPPVILPPAPPSTPTPLVRPSGR